MAVIVKEHSINWGLQNSRATQKNYVDDTSYRNHFANRVASNQLRQEYYECLCCVPID